MISSNEFKTGMTIEYDGNLFQVIEFQHVKPGKGQAFVRTKLRNLRTGSVTDYSFNAGEKVEKAHIDKRVMQYVYSTGEALAFMDMETFEQVEIQTDRLKWEMNFLYEGMEVNLTVYNGEILGVGLPDKVVLEVIQSDPAVKGNTATNATKDATLQTGYIIQVPMFIEAGEKIIVTTADGKYSSRA